MSSSDKTHRAGKRRVGATQVSAGPSSRRTPRQARAVDTVCAIERAAAELFGEHGFAATTTNKIAVRAGVSIGSLYQYFPDKAAIAQALLERHVHEVHGLVEQQLERLADERTPLRAALAELLEALVALHEQDPKLHRFLGEAGMCPGIALEPEREQRQILEFEKILRARGDVHVRDPRLAARIVGCTIESLVQWLVHSKRDDTDRAAFIAESVTMVAGFLEGRGDGSGAQ